MHSTKGRRLRAARAAIAARQCRGLRPYAFAAYARASRGLAARPSWYRPPATLGTAGAGALAAATLAVLFWWDHAAKIRRSMYWRVRAGDLECSWTVMRAARP